MGPSLLMQILSHCHRCCGHMSTPGKCNQETVILAGNHTLACMTNMGGDTLGHRHPQGAPCWGGAQGPFLPMQALVGAQVSKCFSPGHMPQGQDQSRVPGQGNPDQGIRGLSGVLLGLAEGRPL